MHSDEGDIVLTERELADCMGALGLTCTGLGLRVTPTTPTGDPFAELSAAERERLASALTALATPAKRVRFHYTIAAEAITRSLLAWGAPGDRQVATMIKTGRSRRIGIRSDTELASLVRTLLAADSTVTPATLSLGMSAGTLLVLLAVMEQVKALRLAAQLRHSAPHEVFNRADLLARLGESATEDFRWPLLFLAKVLPVRLTDAVTGEDVDLALRELAAVELIEPFDESGETGVHDLTPEGAWLVDALLSEVSKVACSISEYRPDGLLGHETMLFIRSARHLFLFDLAGSEGVVAGLVPPDLDPFLEVILAPPETPAVTPAAGARLYEFTVREPVEVFDPESYEPIGWLQAGSRYEARSEQGGWVLAAGAGVEGWVARSAIAPISVGACTTCGADLAPPGSFCVSCGAAQVDQAAEER